jgi:HlyD family secretion protein
MKRWLVYLAALLCLGGLAWWWVKSQADSQGGAFTTEAVEQGDLESSVTATGTLEAVTAVDVGSEVSGVIDKLYVAHNSIVKKGQLLAQINPETVQAEVNKAQASLQRYQSSLANATAGAASARAGIKTAQAQALSARARLEKARAQEANARASWLAAQANVRQAEANRDNAKRSYDRLQALRDQDLVSQDERDQAQAQYLAAQAALDGARASLEGARASYRSATIDVEGSGADAEAAQIAIEAAREQLASAQAQIDGARADVSQGQANLEAARVNLGKTSIRSPIDGIVLDVLVSEGQTVAAQFQAPNLFTLARNLEEMQVSATVDEADIGQIRTAAPATFTVDAWPDATFEGKVSEVRQSAVTTNNVVTYPVIVRTNNSGLRLKPGMTATVSIAIERRHGVLMVPNSALRFRPANHVSEASTPAAKASPGRLGKRTSTVYTLSPDDPSQTVPHRVVPGLTDGSHTELLESDLKPGDLVVTGSTQATATPTANRRRGPPPF